MKIGIDCRIIFDEEKNKGAGIERFVFYLVKNILKHDKDTEFVLFFDKKYPVKGIEDLIKDRKNVDVIKFGNSIPFFSKHVIAAARMKMQNLSICLFSATSMPLFYFGKSLSVVHDMAIYLHPEWFPNKQWFSTKIVVPFSLYKANKIISISRVTEFDMKELFSFTNDKDTSVIYQGVQNPMKFDRRRNEKVLKKLELTEPFLFFVGTIEPRKNLSRLVKSFGKVNKIKPELSLVIAGGPGWKNEKIFQTINQVNAERGSKVVHYIGKISDTDKASLMQSCELFCFPSHYEGFGLPVYEALSYGKPVVASQGTVFVETVKNMVTLIDPLSVVSIKAGIIKALGGQGRGIVENVFDWQETVRKYMSFITDLEK